MLVLPPSVPEELPESARPELDPPVVEVPPEDEPLEELSLLPSTPPVVSEPVEPKKLSVTGPPYAAEVEVMSSSSAGHAVSANPMSTAAALRGMPPRPSKDAPHWGHVVSRD